jgi:hypothetical protein
MSRSDLTVTFPVVFGPQRDRPRKGVKVVTATEVAAPAQPAPRTRNKRRGTPAADGTPALATPVPAPTDAPTSRTARSLALATLIHRKIEAGEIRDHAHAAELLGMTAVNVGYIMNLLHLAADIQEALIMGELVTSERSLRPVAKVLGWEDQHRHILLSAVLPKR